MSYRGGTDRNWGGLIASALAVPLVFVWIIVEFWGGAFCSEDGEQEEAKDGEG